MRRVRQIIFFVAVWFVRLAVPLTAADDSLLIVKVSVPGSIFSSQALTNVEAACRHLALNQTAESAAALRRAAEEMPASPLIADLKTAADLLVPASGESMTKPKSSGAGSVPFFALMPGNEHSPPRAFLGIPLPREQVWLTPYLEEPARLRPDLPEKMPGVSADMTALPAVRMVDLVAASHAESLSAWITSPDGSGMVAVFRNLVVAYGRDHLEKTAPDVLSAPWSRHVDEKALEWLVAMHRVAHGLGPLAVRKDTGEEMVSVASEMGGNARRLETIKADGLAFLAGLRLARTQTGFGLSAEKITATYVMYLLDRTLHGSTEQKKALQPLLSQMIADGGIRMDLKSGRLIPDSRRMRESVKKMVQRVVQIQGNGSAKEAEELLARSVFQIDKDDLIVALKHRGISGFRLVADVTDSNEKK
ncbi:MAG: hypothetical protein JXA62_08800 [Candidatus Aminicenantes bacterium]|nr:hypothetical protein [Candidatus Aminicenantes bacterium]